jgi:plastocyanin
LPIYTFTVGGSALDVTTYEFIPGSKYKFVGGSTLNTNHPFFISDQGRLTASSSFDITSRKAYNTGIKVGESLEFQLPLDFSGTLTYYCVPHAEMTKTFKVASSATTTTMTTRFEVSFGNIIISFFVLPMYSVLPEYVYIMILQLKTRTIVNLERKRNRVGFF